MQALSTGRVQQLQLRGAPARRPAKAAPRAACSVLAVAGERRSAAESIVVRRQVLGFGVAALVGTLTPRAMADGLETIDLIPDMKAPQFLLNRTERLQKEYEKEEADFMESPLLKDLLAKTKENDKTRKRDLENKYCMRGAKYGYGDCAGFKFDDDGNIIID